MTTTEGQSIPPSRSVLRTAITDTHRSLGSVFANPSLRHVQLAFIGSSIGDWAYATAVTVWAYGVGGAEAVGIWMAIRLFLMAFTTPVGALLVDRWPRKRVMIFADVLRAALIAVAAVLVAVDVATAVVFVLATLASLLSSPFLIAQRALLPSLSRSPEELTAANGVHSTVDSLACFIGPALAGLLLTFTSVPVVFAVNVVTFLWSLVLVRGVVVPPGPGEGSIDEAADAADETAPDESFLSETLAGFRLIGSDRALLMVTAAAALQTVVAGASAVFLVVMAADLLSSGTAGLGYLMAVMGIGSVVGGLIAISRASRQRLARDLNVGVVMWAVPLLLVTVWPSAAACYLAAAIIGLANPFVDVNMDTIFQRLTPEPLLGRAFGALESCLIATMALGAFVMPYLIDGLGLQAALAAIAVPVGLFALVGYPWMVRLDRELLPPRGLELLRGLEIFSPLDPSTVDALARKLEPVLVGPGDVVLREGEDSDRFYVIESGLVEVGQGERLLRTESAGEFFGEIGLLRDIARTATVTATSATVLLALDRADFLTAVSTRGDSRRLVEDVARRRLAT